MLVELDQETEELIRRELEASRGLDARSLVGQAVREYVLSHPPESPTDSMPIPLIVNEQGALGPDGLYDAERRMVAEQDSPEHRRAREQAVEAFLRTREHIRLGPDLTLKELVNAGRRL